ncbi:hypothetical protein KIN20_028043, partial [Parelaphostrongylus tenuis]
MLQLTRVEFRHLYNALVMQTVFDVLERRARSALLPDAAISSILGQLDLTIRYTPVKCDMMVNPEEK